MKEYAIKENVPIVTDEGLAFICNLIKKNNSKKILEIGSAIGYSAINFSKTNDCEVFTIERNEKLYEVALENIKNNNLENKITIVNADALEFDETILKDYDLLFIDAAKAQYEKFFKKYVSCLKEDAIIVCDNLDFHGLVDNSVGASRNVRQLVRKINNFIDFLKTNEEFETEFFNIGDGISVTKRKK